jgi:hypothetical protein
MTEAKRCKKSIWNNVSFCALNLGPYCGLYRLKKSAKKIKCNQMGKRGKHLFFNGYEANAKVCKESLANFESVGRVFGSR